MPLLPFSDASPPTTNASLLTSGTLADARLSSNVALLTGTQSFTGQKTFAAGTITASTPLSITQTWNSGATTFTGIYANITDTASAAASLLLDLQVGGTSVANITKAGTFICPNTFLGGFRLGNGTAGMYLQSGGTHIADTNGSQLFARATGLGIRAAAYYGWAPSTDTTAIADLVLYRDAANTLAQRNGTTAQAFRVYNTYTDASNYERGVFDWTTNANTLTIGTTNAGTGTARRVRIQSAESFDIFCGGTNRPANFTQSQINLYNSTNSQWYSAASDPTSSTAPFSNGTGTCAVIKNTTSGVVKLWVNDGGTMKSVTLA